MSSPTSGVLMRFEVTSGMRTSRLTIAVTERKAARGTDVTMVGVLTRLDWFGTLRARLGVTVAPTFLLYATGGLAYGGVRLNTLVNQQVTNSLVPPSFASASNSSTRVGWTIGVGGEYAFSQNWSAKVEYLYYDLGRAAQNFAHTASTISGAPFFTNAVVTRTKFRVQTYKNVGMISGL